MIRYPGTLANKPPSPCDNRIGSLFIEGSLYQVPTDVVLAQVSWYWLTRSYGRSLWAYRAGWPAMLRDDSRTLPSPLAITKKPLGYSWYPGEVLTVAKSWLEHWFPENLVLFREHANVCSNRLLFLLFLVLSSPVPFVRQIWIYD